MNNRSVACNNGVQTQYGKWGGFFDLYAYDGSGIKYI